MGQALCGLSRSQLRAIVKKSAAYKFFEGQKVHAKSLAHCLEFFLEGTPDERGNVRCVAVALPYRLPPTDAQSCPSQLSYERFAKLLILKPGDPQTVRLCQAFDADGSGEIDFRECVDTGVCSCTCVCGRTPTSSTPSSPQVCVRYVQVPRR